MTSWQAWGDCKTLQNFWLIDSRVITEHYGHFNQGKGRSPPPFKYLVESLPNTIPQSGSETTKYGFDLVDNDSDLEDRGLVGTFNCQRDSRVEIHLYHCNNGPIIFSQGPGLPKLVSPSSLIFLSHGLMSLLQTLRSLSSSNVSRARQRSDGWNCVPEGVRRVRLKPGII